MKEETGLEIIERGLLAVSNCEYDKDDDKIHEIVIAYLFKAKNDDVNLSEEHSEFKWVTLDEMRKIPNLALTVKAILSDIDNALKT